MQVCPKCKAEYDDKERKCPKCGQAKEMKDGRKGWTVLTTVSNDIEFKLVEGLLGLAEIPVVREVKGIDSFVQIVIGVPIAGIDVLVPKDKYEEALQLLEAGVEEEEEIEGEKQGEEDD